MIITADQANVLFSILTVIGQIISLITIAVLVISWKKKKSHKLLEFLNKHAIKFGFIVALVSMIGSLTYSEIIGYVPCTLCWYQRILMYPQVLLLGLALIKKDRKIYDYIISICILGISFALYQYGLQIGVAPSLICSITSPDSCAQVQFVEFGYITIPMMSFTAFSMIFLYMLGMKLHHKLNSK